MGHVIEVPKGAVKGGLNSITDSTAMYSPGTTFTDTGEDGQRRVYMYGLNALSSAAMVQNTPYHRSWGIYGTTFIAIADNLTNIALVGVAQAAIPNAYYGWFQVEGPSVERVIGASLSPTDGQEAYFNNGAVAARTQSLLDAKGFAVFIEARTTSTTYYLWLYGREALNTS